MPIVGPWFDEAGREPPARPPWRLEDVVRRAMDDVRFRPYYGRKTWRCVATVGAAIPPSPDDVIGELVV